MRDRFSQAYLWYVVAVLTIASTFSIIDRQILNVMIGPVKRDLGGISDFQVSLIMGFAFTFLYSVLSYPAGWVADRYNRKNLMAVGIAAWSAMTMLCGMVSQYWHLFATRMGVGVGEATLQPAATSSLSDYFPPHVLPLAMGIVASAPFIGQGLANIAGGPLIDYLEATPNYVLPLFGEVFSWQMVFLLVGAPGLLVALAMWGLREPSRHGKQTEEAGVPLREVWAFVKDRGAFFFLVFTAYLCLATQGWSLFSWLVEFYVRNHEWTRTEIGLTYGFIAMFVGMAGSIIGGAWAGRLIRRDSPDGTIRVVMYGSIVLLPVGAAITIVPDPWLGVALLVPATFCMAMPPGLIMATLQAIAPNELRGQMVAFYLIAVNFLAYTFAPSLPAVLSDFVFGSEMALGKSISLLAVVNYTISSLCLALGLKHYRRALDRARAWASA